MLQISSCAAVQVVEQELALYLMPTHLTLAYVIDERGAPARIRAESHVEVPLGSWGSPDAEDEAIVRVMMQNALEFTLLAPSLRSIERSFWMQIQRNTRALILHPSLRGRFFVPEHSEVFSSSAVTPDRVLCVGPPGRAGTILVRGDRRGYILPVQDGVMSVRIGGIEHQ